MTPLFSIKTCGRYALSNLRWVIARHLAYVSIYERVYVSLYLSKETLPSSVTLAESIPILRYGLCNGRDGRDGLQPRIQTTRFFLKAIFRDLMNPEARLNFEAPRKTHCTTHDTNQWGKVLRCFHLWLMVCMQTLQIICCLLMPSKVVRQARARHIPDTQHTLWLAAEGGRRKCADSTTITTFAHISPAWRVDLLSHT